MDVFVGWFIRFLKMVHEFDPVIYPIKLYVAVGEISKTLSENFVRYDNGSEIQPMDDSMGLAVTEKVRHKDTNKYGVAIIFGRKKDMNINYICHESVHAAKYMFEHINAEIEPHEPFEYLTGWIAECIETVKKTK